MTLYLDTSLLVASMTNESETERIQIWLSTQDEQALIITEWVATEFSYSATIRMRHARQSG